jgi:FMN reductase
MNDAVHLNSPQPFIVGIGGSVRRDSATEKALLVSLKAAEEAGARTTCFGGAFLAKLPVYATTHLERTPEERLLVETMRAADGVIVATPGYHGGVSGLVKNALDLLEDLREDNRCYLDGRAVGCIVTASGWQTVGATLVALRSIVHALRGWPTPLGATLNTSEGIFDAQGACTDEKCRAQLVTIGRQVTEFAVRQGRPAASAAKEII